MEHVKVLKFTGKFTGHQGDDVTSTAANQSVCLHFFVNANFFTDIVKAEDRDPAIHVG
jgi:hypothetical protein